MVTAGLALDIQQQRAKSCTNTLKLRLHAKEEVGKAVEEAKSSPELQVKDLWSDIYYKGTEPPFMRGPEHEEVCMQSSVLIRPL
jgi:pyruvate dehydrogenase E1 component alpha subunit